MTPHTPPTATETRDRRSDAAALERWNDEGGRCSRPAPYRDNRPAAKSPDSERDST